MADRLVEFLIALAENPELMKRFVGAHQEKVMKEAGLSNEERSALRSRDPERIRKLLPRPHPSIYCHIIYKKPTQAVDID
jgi:hypothetical protein